MSADRKYCETFGFGGLNNHIDETVKKEGNPGKIFFTETGDMASLVYKNKVIVVSYENDYPYPIEFALEVINK